MGEKGMNGREDPKGGQPEDLRALGRAAADELQQNIKDENGSYFDWFDALYAEASGRRGFIPWSEAAPRFKLKEWLAARDHRGAKGDGRRAVDVGCGLGDNAQCLAEAGYEVTGFDISKHAVAWALKNNATAQITFEVADIFDLPARWLGGFDLVHETYNLQAMPPEYVAPAAAAIASLVAPGGTLLVMTRGREAHEEIDGPPRPLCREQLSSFEKSGLKPVEFEEFYDEGERPIRHFLAEYRKNAE